MSWRWIVPALALFAVIELTMGILAYNTPSWNLSHTEAVSGWAGVREVCLLFVPIFLGIVLLGAFLVGVAVLWARRR
jgi:hypothetical protein